MPATGTRKKTTKKKTNRRTTVRKRGMTPEDLLQFRLPADAQVAPDGGTIVFVRKHVGEKNEYVSNLWLVAPDGASEPRQFTSSGKDSQPRWSPDGSTIAFTSGRDKPKSQIFTIPASGGEARALTRLPEGSIGALKWSPDGKTIAVAFREQDPDWTDEAKKDREKKGLSDPPRVLDDVWYRLDGDGYFNAQRHHLYLVDAATGAHRNVYSKDTLGFFTFDFSPDSKQIVIATNRDKKAMIRAWKDELLRLNLRTGKLTPIPGLPDGPKTEPRWSPDGKTIAYAGREGREDIYSVENLECYICDPVKGGARSLTGKEDYCLMAIALTDTAEAVFGPNLQWAPDSRRVLMQIGWHGESHIASIARRGGKLKFLTSGAVDQIMGNVSTDGKTMALISATTTQLPDVYVGDVDRKSVSTRRLTNCNRDVLKQIELPKPTSHWITSADGNKVQVWVMKPRGHKDGRKYPTVLEVHGGPHAQYGVGFFHEFHVLAAAGYCVVYSNPRGSKGYGRDHTAAIKGDWGTADWVDVQAVIEFMKGQPFVDVKRMGIMGGSYGGYMTNWAIGHTREFAGAITDRCVSNMVSMGGTSDFVDEPDGYFPGNFWDKPEARWKQSPIRHIGNAKTPTLIIHSEGDLRCNIEQAEQVFSALTLLNVPTRFVRYPRSTSHGMSRKGPADMRLHRLHQILGWWERWLRK